MSDEVTPLEIVTAAVKGCGRPSPGYGHGWGWLCGDDLRILCGTCESALVRNLPTVLEEYRIARNMLGELAGKLHRMGLSA